MRSLEKLVNQITFSVDGPICLVLIIFIGILLVLLFWPIQYHIKIHNFILTYFGAFIYICGYILLFLCLRIMLLKNSIDLHRYFNFIEIFFASSISGKITYLLYGLLIFLLWILIFFKLRKILSWKIWQLHFYWFQLFYVTFSIFKRVPKFPSNSFIYKHQKISSKYVSFINYVEQKYSLPNVCAFFIRNLKNYIKILFNYDYSVTFFNLVYAKRVRYTVLIGLLGIFSFECIWNNWILHYTIYYLLFYMLFAIWYKISFDLFKSDLTLDKIIFEREYCYPEILFVNLTENEELELTNYIKNPTDRSTQTPLPEYYSDGLFPWGLHPIYFHRRFFKSELNFKTVWMNIDREAPSIIWFKYSEVKKINGKYFVHEDPVIPEAGEDPISNWWSNRC